MLNEPAFCKNFLSVTGDDIGCRVCNHIDSRVLTPQKCRISLVEQGKPREAAQQLEAEASRASGAQHNQLLADAALLGMRRGDCARASAGQAGERAAADW